MPPLVSVITCSWQRHQLLAETIQHVRAQTYRPLEMVIVSEGDDLQARMIVTTQLGLAEATVPIRYAECGRNWTTYLENSRNAAPMIVGQLLAAGEYLTWLPDDDRATPDHISKLVDALEETGADFSYSMTEMWRKDNPSHRWVIGSDPPAYGQITNCLYKASLIEKGLTRLNAGGCPDWLQIDDWMKAGATWAFLPEVTLSHRVDL